MASGDTKTEALMNILENGGDIEGISGSGNTKFQDYIVDNILSIDSAKDAIASKGGTVGDTGLAGLADEIASIPSGGSNTYSDDVRFIDYDGTIIAQMSIAEAQALTALPTVPTHNMLTFDGWTHTLQEVKATTRKIDIGATYVSSNNARETIFKAYQSTLNNPLTFNFTQDTDNGVTVDWGDGSTPETYSGTGTAISATHTYAASFCEGAPVYIRLLPNANVNIGISSLPSNCQSLLLGECDITTTAFGNLSLDNLIVSRYFKGNTIMPKSTGLKAAIIPSAITLTSFFCDNCASLQYAIATNVETFGLPGCSSIQRVIIPSGTLYLSGTTYTAGGLSGTKALREVVMNEQLQTTDRRCFTQATALRDIIIPSSITTLGTEMLRSAGARRIIFKNRSTMPAMNNSFMQINNYAVPVILDFTECQQIPTLDGAFLGNYTDYYVIYVPASLETQWKSASNWDQYSSIIIGV